MKKFLFFTFPMALIATSCSSQNISRDKVPSVVLNTFQAQHPNSTGVEWEKHGDIYEAEFDVNDTLEIVTRIDEAGKLMMEKQDITVSDLDPAVLTAIQSRYKEYRVDDVEKIQKGSNIFYQVELKAQGKKELNIVLAADGSEDKSLPYWD